MGTTDTHVYNLAYVSSLLIIINLANVAFSCVSYHNHFLTYQTMLLLL